MFHISSKTGQWTKSEIGGKTGRTLIT